MKYLTLLLISIVVCISDIYAQDNHKLKLNNKENNRIPDYIKSMPNRAIHVDYTQIGFFNPIYFQNINKGVIKNNGGFGFTFEQRIWLFRLDIGGFYHFLKSDESTSQKESNYRVNGLNIFASYLPMPDWGKISRIIVPSIGVGYQTASLQQTETGSDDKTEILSSLGIGGPVWKAGLQINLGPAFFINGEYKQSLLLNTEKAINSFSIGLGVKFE